MHHLSNKNNPQGQSIFQVSKILKKKIRARGHFLAITQLLFLLLERHAQCQRAKKCTASPSSKSKWREWGKERKRREHKLVVESRWLPPAPYGYLQMLVNDWTLQEQCPDPSPKMHPRREHAEPIVPRELPFPKGDWTRSRQHMKAMDRADGVLASLSLGTCVRNVGSPVSCLLPEPSILFFSWAVPMGHPIL